MYEPTPTRGDRKDEGCMSESRSAAPAPQPALLTARGPPSAERCWPERRPTEEQSHFGPGQAGETWLAAGRLVTIG